MQRRHMVDPRNGTAPRAHVCREKWFSAFEVLAMPIKKFISI